MLCQVFLIPSPRQYVIACRIWRESGARLRRRRDWNRDNLHFRNRWWVRYSSCLELLRFVRSFGRFLSYVPLYTAFDVPETGTGSV